MFFPSNFIRKLLIISTINYYCNNSAKINVGFFGEQQKLFLYLHNEIKMITHLLYTGTITIAASKALLLLLLDPKKLIKNAETQSEIDDYLGMINDIKHKEDAKAVIAWVVNDNFKSETLKKPNNQFFFKKLDLIKEKFFDYYLGELNEKRSDDKNYTKACDVFAEINSFILRIIRLRCLIEPKIQIAVNKHTQTQIEYLAAKAFWYNQEGIEVRKFTKSMGRLEDYKKGKNDPILLKEAELKIQEIMYKKYLEEYPE